MADAVITLDTILKLGEIIAIVGSAAVALVTVGRITSKLEMKIAEQSSDIIDIKLDLKKLGDLLTQVAVQDKRLDMLGHQINRLEIRYDELRHGKGLITDG